MLVYALNDIICIKYIIIMHQIIIYTYNVYNIFCIIVAMLYIILDLYLNLFKYNL